MPRIEKENHHASQGSAHEEGIATVTVEVSTSVVGAFSGYLQVSYPERLDALVYPRAHPASTQAIGSTTLIGPSLPALVASLEGAEPLAGTGTILISVRDCSQTVAPDVTFALDPPGTETSFYVANGNIDPRATQTDETALGGFVNVTPGRVTVVARALVGEVESVVAKRSVWVRADTLTDVNLLPNE